MILSKFIKSGFDTYTLSSLKNIAFLIMLIDHIGAIIYPDLMIFRIIGRFAFPIFAFITIYNFTFNVKDRLSQLLKLSILAFISQFAFLYAFDYGLVLNIFYMFLAVCIFIYLYEKYNNFNLFTFFFLLCLFLLSSIIEYGFFGFLYCLFIYHFMRDNTSNLSIYLIYICAFLLNGFYLPSFSATLIITTFLILVYIDRIDINLISYRFNKYIYYVFYPVHLLVLKLLV